MVYRDREHNRYYIPPPGSSSAAAADWSTQTKQNNVAYNLGDTLNNNPSENVMDCLKYKSCTHKKCRKKDSFSVLMSFESRNQNC